ncbi:MAG: metallophosphoesterase [Deltaproteobacteria bacterium]|nr:metallophosphoesterase [Deltaproteobacteria bacterium]
MGDIHGRFERVEAWLRELEQVHGKALELAIAVGDLETFVEAEAPLRKRQKRAGAAEFGPYASGAKRMPCPLVFLGGNNEDFAPLHEMQQGGELAPGVRYLGRAGAVALAGARAAFLSGIFAPTSFERPLEPPRTLELARRAGHFRRWEVDAVAQSGPVELLLLHDWPRGLVRRGIAGPEPLPPAFWGNVQASQLVDALRPAWVLCGHQHRAWAGTLGRSSKVSRVACLDEAERPAGAVFWMELERGEIVRAGWGVSAKSAWERGQLWTAELAPPPGS